MKENKYLFTVGLQVWDFEKGWGVVSNVDFNTVYPVEVLFDNGITQTYTTEGKSFVGAKNRILFFEEIPIPESALKRKFHTANFLLSLSKEVKFEENKKNFYVIFSHSDNEVKSNFNTTQEIIGQKYISKRDAEFIVCNCIENNGGIANEE